MEPEELADAIKRLTEWAVRHAPEPEAQPRVRLREHFDADPTDLPIVTRGLQAWDRLRDRHRRTRTRRGPARRGREHHVRAVGPLAHRP